MPVCTRVMPCAPCWEQHGLEMSQAVAFGDGMNDFEMLSMVGRGWSWATPTIASNWPCQSTNRPSLPMKMALPSIWRNCSPPRPADKASPSRIEKGGPCGHPFLFRSLVTTPVPGASDGSTACRMASTQSSGWRRHSIRRGAGDGRLMTATRHIQAQRHLPIKQTIPCHCH